MLKKVNLDGIDYEAEETVIKALNSEKARADKAEKAEKDACEEKKAMDKKVSDLEDRNKELEKRISALEAERDTAKEKADSAEKALEEAKKTALDSKAIDEAVNAKMELLRNAEKAKVEVKADMSDMDIKKAVITSAFPNAKFDGKDDVYIQARYDATVEMLEAKTDGSNRKFFSELPPESRADENDARNRMIARMKNHGQEAK